MTSSSRTASALAWSLAAISVLVGATVALLVGLNWSSVHSLSDAHPIEIVIPISFAVVGGLIASRQPNNPIGWLFLLSGICSGIPGIGDEYVRHARVAGPGIWLAWLANWVLNLVYPTGAAAFILMLFPSGRFVPRYWRFVGWLAGLLTLFNVVIQMFAPELQLSQSAPSIHNPLAVQAMAVFTGNDLVGAAPYLSGLLVLLVAAISPFLRMRRSSAEERQQLKWFAYAVATTVVANVALTLLWFAAYSTVIDNLSTAILALGFGVALPASCAVAILKYRLYDIDVVISRTVVFGLMAVFITAVYLGVVVGVGALVGTGGRTNLLLSLLATAMVALAIQPVRTRLQRFANRVAYGRRATPYEVLSSLSAGLADAFGGEELLTRMARVLAEGTGADSLRILVRVGDRLQQAAVWPASVPKATPLTVTGQLIAPSPDAERVIPVRHQGQLLGAISLAKRSTEALKPIEEQLLEDFAGQAGLVLRNAGLTADLQARLVDLRASRQRLVAAQDEERRRIERNLHDGAQQHLVALKVKLGLAKAIARKDPERAEKVLDELSHDANEALETLRDLARGIYPPLLAEQGLLAALQGQARKATVPVLVEAEGIARYTQEIESAVYFSCLEALQNVQKYAEASRATVTLRAIDAQLTFQVHDEGKGFDPATIARGSGLTNIGDRLDALGGALEITSLIGQGTTVRGRLPLAGVERVA